MDCSPPGSSVHGILKAKVLEWADISSSKGSSLSRDRTCASSIGRWVLYHWATREARLYHKYKLCQQRFLPTGPQRGPQFCLHACREHDDAANSESRAASGLFCKCCVIGSLRKGAYHRSLSGDLSCLMSPRVARGRDCLTSSGSRLAWRPQGQSVFQRSYLLMTTCSFAYS